MHPGEVILPIFVLLICFGIPGIVIFWAIYTKHRERMRLIEKGLPPEEVRKYFESSNSSPKLQRYYATGSLKWAIILIFIGGGIFLANLLEELYEFSDGITFGLVLFSAGLGFLLYYLLAKGKYIEPNDEMQKKNNVNIPQN